MYRQTLKSTTASNKKYIAKSLVLYQLQKGLPGSVLDDLPPISPSFKVNVDVPSELRLESSQLMAPGQSSMVQERYRRTFNIQTAVQLKGGRLW